MYLHRHADHAPMHLHTRDTERPRCRSRRAHLQTPYLKQMQQTLLPFAHPPIVTDRRVSDSLNFLGTEGARVLNGQPVSRALGTDLGRREQGGFRLFYYRATPAYNPHKDDKARRK
jgi:hypothetical protein